MKFNPLIFSGFDFGGSSSGGAYIGFKPTVATGTDLPLVGNTAGDVRTTQDSGQVWVWDNVNTRWVDTGLTTTVSFGSTPNSVGYSLTLNNLGLNRIERHLELQPADATNPGLVSTTTQTFGGAKTFNSSLTVVGATTLATSLTGPLKAASGIVSASAINLASEVTGTLPIANGGTNSSTALNNNRFVVSSGGSLVEHSAVTASRALASNASGLPTASATTDTELDYLSGVTSSVQTQINSKISSTEKGAASGVATLDSGSKIPAAQLPDEVMSYKGNWNASTNTPTLIDGTGNTGDIYKTSVGGTQDLGSGSIIFSVGDWVLYNGTVWEKAINSNSVTSVNGQTGAVVLTTTNIAEGTSLYFTDERAQDAVGGILTNTTTISLTYNDGLNTVAADVNSLSLTNSEISTSAAIARSKLASGTASHVLINDGSGVMSSEATLSLSRGGTGLASTPTNGQILIGNGTNYSLAAISGTTDQVTVTNGAGTITLSTPQSIATTSSPTFAGLTLTAFSGVVKATAGVLSASALVDADVDAAAAIARAKLASGTADHVLINNGSGVMSSEATLALSRGGTGVSSTPSNGQLLIGNGTGYTVATVTGTTNQVSVTNGSGSITLSTPQDIHSAATPTFAGLTLSGFSGFIKATGGVLGTSTISLTADVSGTLPIANGGTATTSVPTNGQLLIGNGTGYTVAALTGTSNQVSVTNGSGTITLSTPQDIATASSPTFAGLTLTAFSGVVKASAGVLSASALSLTTDVSGVLPVANGGTNSSTALNNNRFIVSSGGALVEHSAVTANRALASDANGLPAASATTATELGYVSGVTSSIQTQLGNKIDSSEKGANNGVATLDSGGKVPSSQLPSSVMDYKGNWNASTNTPTLIDGTGSAGDVYRVSVAGTQDLGSGSVTYDIGDWVVYSGTIWEKSSNSNAVTSVNGQTGAVSLSTTNISEGTNQYFTDERAQDAVGGILTNTTTVSLTYNDGLNTIAADVNALSLTDSQISASAAITRSKLASGTADHVLINNGSGVMSSEATLSLSRGGTGLGTAPTNGQLLIGNGTTYTLATITGTSNQVSVSNGAGTITLSTPQDIHSGASPTFAGLTLTGFGGVVKASGGTLSASTIVNADINASAGIERSKIAAGTSNHIVINDGTGFLSSEATLAVSRGGTNLSSTPTNGQLLVGNGSGYTLATITAGTGISVTNGAGTITIASQGSTGDIAETSFTAADNQVSAANVTGFAFANGTVRSFTALVSIVRDTTYAQYTLTGIQKAASWNLDQSLLGDDTGLEFSITSGGQIQYTSTNTGSSATVKFRAITTTV